MDGGERAGAPFLLTARATEADHPIEPIGRDLRAMMPFLVDKTPERDGT